MRLRLTVAAVLAAAPAAADDVRVNQVQVVGTHNSYHVAPAPAVMRLIAAVARDRTGEFDYTHRPLAEQFDRLRIRQIELDVYADPAGGLFADPLARKRAAAAGDPPGPDPNAGGALTKPGFKVLHVPDVDYGSTVPTLAAGLTQLRDWSTAHPRHVPILVLVELKADKVLLLPTNPLPFDAKLLDAVDAEIVAVCGRGRVLTPDDVRGSAAGLPQAIRERGWPTLDSARGKVLFALDNEGPLADRYRAGHPALTGRVMFATAPRPDDPSAAFFKVNDPVKEFDRIRSLVTAGFLVRTRADADTKEARANHPARRDRAFASGAQFVSTDHPEPRAEWSPYVVRLPGGVAARLNPVNRPLGDRPTELEPDPAK